MRSPGIFFGFKIIVEFTLGLIGENLVVHWRNKVNISSLDLEQKVGRAALTLQKVGNVLVTCTVLSGVFVEETRSDEEDLMPDRFSIRS